MAENAPIRVLVAVTDRKRRSEIVRALTTGATIDVIGEASSHVEMLSLTKELSPELVVVGSDISANGGISALEELAVTTSVPAILVSSKEDVELLRAAMVAGAREFISGPSMNGNLVSAVERIVSLDRRRHSRIRTEGDATSDSRTQLIVICGGKGGVGRSVLAVNLSAALANAAEGRVALVDLNLQFGDTALLLNLNPKRSLADIGELEQEFDDELLSYYLTPHDSGLNLILGASTPQPSDLLSRNQVESILRRLRAQFTYIVVDAPGVMGDSLFAVLSSAEQVLLVMTAEDLPTLRDSKLYLDTITDIWGNSDRVSLVINRLHRHSPLTPSDIASTMGIPIMSRIPEDSGVVRSSVNHGIPFVLSNPSCPTSQEIKRLASLFISRAQPKKMEGASQSRRSFGIRSFLGTGREER